MDGSKTPNLSMTFPAINLHLEGILCSHEIPINPNNSYLKSLFDGIDPIHSGPDRPHPLEFVIGLASAMLTAKSQASNNGANCGWLSG
jgi:hypothetical protein